MLEWIFGRKTHRRPERWEALQARFDKVSQATDLGVWFCDLPFGELTWNAKTKQHFWMPENARVTIEDFYEHIHPEDRERTRYAIEHSIEARQSYDIEYRTIRPAEPNQWKWIRAVGWTDYDASGKPTRFDGITLDLTEAKSREEKLKASEIRFRNLADSIPQIAWTTDAAGAMSYVNQNWTDYTGTKLEDIVQSGGIDLVHPDDREIVMLNWQAALSERKGFETEARLKSKSGEYEWFLMRGNAIKNSRGEVEHWFGTNTNIHDQRRSYEILKTINDVGQNISAELDLTSLVQAVTDAATKITGAEFGAFFYNELNEKGESYMLHTISGVPREAFAQFPMPRNTLVFEPTFRNLGVVRSNDITKDPRYGKSNPYYGMPKGHLPVVSYLAVSVVSRSGEVIGGLFFGHSKPGIFTAREEEIVKGLSAQAAIAIDNAKLFRASETAVRVRDEFLSIASHELQTPLTGLSLSIQLRLRDLKRNNAEAFSQEKLEKIFLDQEAFLKRLNRLVNDILDVSRMTKGKIEFHKERFDLSEAVSELVERFQVTTDAQGVALTLHCQPALVGVWDRFRIEQALLNLLTNAIRYGNKKPIHVEVLKEGALAVVKVKDHGMGIHAKDQGRIFNRFERAISKNEVSGLGLGLFITDEIVKAHEGNIRVVSSPGQGAEFIVSLPLSGE